MHCHNFINNFIFKRKRKRTDRKKGRKIAELHDA